MTSKSVAIKMPQVALPGAEKWVETRTTPEPFVPIKRLTLDIPAELHRKLKTHCASTGLNMAELCRDLISKALPTDAA